MKILASFFSGLTDNSPLPLRLEIEDILDDPAITDDPEKLPLWSPALYPPKTPRSKTGVREVSALFYDIDGPFDTSLVVDAPFATYAHTTKRATASHHRWRVIVPLETPIPASQWQIAHRSIMTHLGISHLVDPQCLDICHFFFTPAVVNGGFYASVESICGDYPSQEALEGPHVNEFASTSVEVAPQTEAVPEASTALPVIPKGDTQALLRHFAPWVRKENFDILRDCCDLKVSFTDHNRHRKMLALTGSMGGYPKAPHPDELDWVWKLLCACVELRGDPYEHWLHKIKKQYADMWYKTSVEREAYHQRLAQITERNTDGSDDWKGELLYKKNKLGDNEGLKKDACNLTAILRGDPAFKGSLRYNTLLREAEFIGSAVDSVDPEYVCVAISDWLQRKPEYALTFTHQIIGSHLHHVCHENPFNPIKNWLQSLRWDGTHRAEKMFSLYGDFENPDNYLSLVAKKFLMSCVARGVEPGCKVDESLMLTGYPGRGKSTFAAIIGGDWKSTLDGNVTQKDSVLNVFSNWVIELPEMSINKASDVDAVNGFLTRTEDPVRIPYLKMVKKYPRPCVFIGTTNKPFPLSDRAYARRFHPLTLSYLDVPALREDRDQIFAEAYQMHLAGETHVLSAEESVVVRGQQDAYMVISPVMFLSDAITRWYLEKNPRPECVTHKEIVMNVLPKAMAQFGDKIAQNTIGEALNSLGFRYVRSSGMSEYSQHVFLAPTLLRNRIDYTTTTTGVNQ